jgi:hypothetical protein
MLGGKRAQCGYNLIQIRNYNLRTVANLERKSSINNIAACHADMHVLCQISETFINTRQKRYNIMPDFGFNFINPVNIKFSALF